MSGQEDNGCCQAPPVVPLQENRDSQSILLSVFRCTPTPKGLPYDKTKLISYIKVKLFHTSTILAVSFLIDKGKNNVVVCGNKLKNK